MGSLMYRACAFASSRDTTDLIGDSFENVYELNRKEMGFIKKYDCDTKKTGARDGVSSEETGFDI